MLKKILHNFKPKVFGKKIFILIKTHKYHKDVVLQLKKQGFKHIKKYSLQTWKYYGNNLVRLTYTSFFNGKKIVIKVAKGFDKKTLNGLKFITLFGNRIDFTPSGFEIKIDGFISYATFFLETISFNSVIKSISTNDLPNYLEQFCKILDCLYDLGIVHCDLESVNILVEKDTKKLFLIDFDTACSRGNELNCDEFPTNGIRQTNKNGQSVYDDAFSILTLINRMPFTKEELSKIYWYNELIKKIGRNVYIRKIS